MTSTKRMRTQKLRRTYEAAVRDNTPDRFFGDFQEALDQRQVSIDDYSIRSLFEEFVVDGHEAVCSWSPGDGWTGGVSMRLLEEAGAVTSGGFGKISGQIVYSMILEKYNLPENVFSKLVTTKPTEFNGEKIAGISQIGDEAEIVAEGRTYPQAGVSEDFIETPVTTKRGLIVGLTKEAIFFDRTGVLVDRCGAVGEWLGLNKEKRIIDCIIDENTTAYRFKWKGTVYATYQSSNAAAPFFQNLKTGNALVDWSNVDACELLGTQLTDPFTGEPITIEFKHLVVTRQNMNVAKRILTATQVQTVTPGFALSGNPNKTDWSNPITGYQMVWSQLLAARMATTSNWYAGDITKAFAYMENWPITVVEAPSNSEVEFQSDVVMRWKASERGTPATLDPRRIIKNTVA